jgi:CubicO group peptidase (beta-lactamase class C family)
MRKGFEGTKIGRVIYGLFLLAFVSFFLVPMTTAAWAAPDNQDTEIDAYIRTQMAAAQIPGVALAIIRDDQIVALRSYGVAGPNGRPMTAQTPMVVGSVSKPLTALAVLRLVEQGKLDLDTPVQFYLPWFQLADETAAKQMTVRQLLTHTSGFTTAQGRVGLARNAWDDDALTQYGRELATVHPATAPGERWQYSNANYGLLGLLIQTVADVSYEQYMHEQVFAPLEMANSYVRLDIAQQHGLAVGYRYWFEQPIPEPNPPDPRGLVPGTNLVASAEDLGHVVIAQLNGGRYNGRPFLAPEFIAAMQESVTETGAPGEAYGLGLGVKLIDGQRIHTHTGHTANFYSQIIFSTTERWGVVVLMNANTALAPTATAAINQVGFGVAERVVGHPIVQLVPIDSNLFWIIIISLGSLLVVQVARLAWVVVGLRQRPTLRHWRVGQLLILAVDLVLIWGILVMLPGILSTPFDTMLVYQPDISWLLVVFAGVTLMGIGLRIMQLLFARHGTSEG